jgi:glycosyltransferase involved in cell wall biosynthesis
MTQPLISIITPCLNRAGLVRQAVESVLAQGYPEVEHIVMDAGSTDGTLQVLRAYPHLRLFSEPDKGMYDGINKGLRLAHGQIVGLLNTDDLYAPGCFEAVAAAFDRHPEALAVVGGVSTFVDGPNGPVTVNTVPPIEPDELWYRLIQGHPVTNAWFFRPAVFEKVGYFDDRSLYSSDRYFLIRLALDGGVRPVPIRQTLYHYRQHSGSATISTIDSRSPKYGRLRMKFLQEDVDALEEFLRRPDLPGEVRRRMRREHGERCYRLSATAFYHRRWRVAFEAARRGWAGNALWPLLFVEMAARRVLKGGAAHA